PSGAGADQVRTGGQPQDRQSARARNSVVRVCARRRGDRITMLCVCFFPQRSKPTKFFGRYPQSGLTALNEDIGFASSIGRVVCSSAVVVGRRSERGVP